jgi:hypothetical protein
MLGLILFAAAAAQNPLVTFKEWTAGCDNGRRCMAVGQFNGSNYDIVTVAFERGPLPGDAPSFWFSLPEQSFTDLAADGRPLGLKFARDEEVARVAPESMPVLVAALRSARAINPVGSDGKLGLPLSADGASAALRWIDAQQKRAGTVTALVASGPAPASAVPPPPALPVVHRVRGSSLPPDTLPPAQLRKLRNELFECEDEELEGVNEPEAIRLDASTSLVMLSARCASGAYNFFYEPLLVRRGKAPVSARFLGRGKSEDEVGLYNLTWDPEERTLATYFKGRGIGDCGGGAEYVWDGAVFRPVRESMMDDCRGAITWITTFRARVVDR